MILYDSPGIESGLNIHLEEPVSTKTDLKEPHKANIHETAEIAKTLITDTNVKMQKRWCHEPGQMEQHIHIDQH